jgi:hypothetical protein
MEPSPIRDWLYGTRYKADRIITVVLLDRA